jgi:transcriptional regulator with XRE-family HTH domain
MDAQKEIREFLASRRARLTPESIGLPDYGGRRRVTGLRREEVALVAGISVEYYTRLERGNATGVSESVLDGIGRALQLDDVEYTHLHDLVRAATASPGAARRTARPAQVTASVRQLMDAMEGIAVLV